MTGSMTTRGGQVHRWTAALIVAHLVALFAGFTVLAAVFQFPEVLRLPAVERLALFRREQAVVQPTYWLLALTGLSQVAIAVLVDWSLCRRPSAAVRLALVFGIVCGVLQMAGFIRWAILVPYLADRMAGADAPTASAIVIVEGAFNRYAGMALGEHAANLCLGLWTILVSAGLRRQGAIDARLGSAGIALGAFALVLALEQLGIAPQMFGPLLDFGFPAWAVWLLLLGVCSWRSQAEGAIELDWRAWAVGLALYVAMIVPAIL